MKYIWVRFLDFLFDCIVKFAKNICKVFSTKIGSYVFFIFSIIFSVIFILLFYVIKMFLIFILTIYLHTRDLFLKFKDIFKYCLNYSSVKVREKFKEEYEFFNEIDNNDDIEDVLKKLNTSIRDITPTKEDNHRKED